MGNFYTDNKAIAFHLKNKKLGKVVSLKERGFNHKDDEHAPLNFEDALDNYDKILEIVGEIAADIIDKNAESVDVEGPKLENNRVSYAKGTNENLKYLRDAGLMGMTLPRKYQGLNFPTSVYCMAVEIISRADASLMNLFGLQDIAETIKEFANEEVKEEFLPPFAQGDVTGAMILTEPDAGSDLQAVKLKASEDENGVWRLNGVKRFITNGNAEVSLVLARTEEGSTDGRGLSMFIYERDDNVQIRRIENKMGIHGSPTCEMVFKNAPAILVGRRRYGLIRYVMSLMNGARLGVSCQSIGLAEAAYREAHKYAKERMQFGKEIREFPAVYELLSNMKLKIEASRALLYETARFVDIYKEYEEIEKERALTNEEKKELKEFKRRSDIFTPLLKGISSEYCNEIAYDAIQVHGGTGFMRDFPVERLYRDARITSIYEGTTQLQVVAALRGVSSGFYADIIKEYKNTKLSHELDYLKKKLNEMESEYLDSVKYVMDFNDGEFLNFHGRRLVEMAGNLIMGYLMLESANRDSSGEYKSLSELFIKVGESENRGKASYIKRTDIKDLSLNKEFAFFDSF